MGFFDIFRKKLSIESESSQDLINKKHSIDVQLAEYILRMYGGGLGIDIHDEETLKKEVERLKSKCRTIKGENYSERIFLLASAGDRLGKSSEIERKLKYDCYHYAGACRYKELIPIAKEIAASSTFEWAYNQDFEKWAVQLNLAKTYEQVGKYQEALEIQEELHIQCPWEHNHVEAMVRCLIHLQAYDTAFSLIDDVRQSAYYKMSGLEVSAQ